MSPVAIQNVRRAPLRAQNRPPLLRHSTWYNCVDVHSTVSNNLLKWLEKLDEQTMISPQRLTSLKPFQSNHVKNTTKPRLARAGFVLANMKTNHIADQAKPQGLIHEAING